jgi:sulfopyruvate decarboxylase subunit beta
MKRYDCLRTIAPRLADELVITNIGAVRHEWQALRPHHGNYHLQNLGLTSSVALGLALALPHRKVVAFDGDGSLLLNLGSLATMANQHPRNLIHVVFDNECYESSRGAPTATAGQADLAAVARGCGFANVITAKSLEEFDAGFSRALGSNDLYFILAKVEPGAGDVPAAALDSQENKYLFVRYIEKSESVKILTSTLSRASDDSRERPR